MFDCRILDYPRQILLNSRIAHPRLTKTSAVDTLMSAISTCVPQDLSSIECTGPQFDSSLVYYSSKRIELSKARNFSWTFHGRDRIQEWDPFLIRVAIHTLVHDTICATPSQWLVELKCIMSAGMTYLSVHHYPQDEAEKVALNVSVGQTYHLYDYSLQRHKPLGLAIRNAARIANIHHGGLTICGHLGHGIRYHMGLLAHRMNTRRNTIAPSRLQRILTLA